MYYNRDYKIKGYVKILLIVLVMTIIIPIGGVGYTTPSINITSWENNATNDESLTLNVVQGTTVKFNVTTNVNAIYNDSSWDCGTGRWIDWNLSKNNLYLVCKFDTVGRVYPVIRAYDASGDYDARVWKINVIPKKKGAQLEVSYELLQVNKDTNIVTIKLHVKNIGDSTASKINIKTEIPVESKSLSNYGIEKNEFDKGIGKNEISESEFEENYDGILWNNGRLIPGKEFIKVKSIRMDNTKGFSIPLNVTYKKFENNGFGISSFPNICLVDTDDVISLFTSFIVPPNVPGIPGFELIMAISILLLVHVFLRNRI